MFRKLVVGALGAMIVLFSTTAFAQSTAADAKAMLEKTVAAIKANKAKTLDQINKGENGFLLGDLYTARCSRMVPPIEARAEGLEYLC